MGKGKIDREGVKKMRKEKGRWRKGERNEEWEKEMRKGKKDRRIR